MTGVRVNRRGANWLRDGREVPVGLIDDLKGKAQGLIQGNEEAIKNGIEKAGDFVDEKTGGKYAGHVDKVQNAASDFVAKHDGEPGTAPVTDEPKQP
nr:antitoxin [Paenarthrobacter ilicis]